jgi:dTDP-glucose 4,6-dehydratase
LPGSRAILRTEGVGFIGSAVVRYLMGSADYRVGNVGKLVYALITGLLEAIEDDPWDTSDWVDNCKATELERSFETHRPHAVMHLAAGNDVQRSMDRPNAVVQMNLEGPFMLLNAVRPFCKTLLADGAEDFRFRHTSMDDLFDETGDGAPSWRRHLTTRPRPTPGSWYTACEHSNLRRIS